MKGERIDKTELHMPLHKCIISMIITEYRNAGMVLIFATIIPLIEKSKTYAKNSIMPPDGQIIIIAKHANTDKKQPIKDTFLSKK